MTDYFECLRLNKRHNLYSCPSVVAEFTVTDTYSPCSPLNNRCIPQRSTFHTSLPTSDHEWSRVVQEWLWVITSGTLVTTSRTWMTTNDHELSTSENFENFQVEVKTFPKTYVQCQRRWHFLQILHDQK